MERFRPRMGYLLLLFSLLCQSLDLCACVNDEGKALFRFREGVAFDPYGALSNWIEGADDSCSWFGVECSDDGRVISLNLKDLLLEGTLTPELGKLTHMQSLILRNNSFCGTIPTEIGELRKLEILDLGHNKLSGAFPSEIGNILSLETLILRGNGHISNIPPQLHGTSRISIISNTENATMRKLLQETGKHKGNHHRHHKHNHLAPAPAPSPSPSRSPIERPPTIRSKPSPPPPSPSPSSKSSTKGYLDKLRPPPSKTGHHSHLIAYLSVALGSSILVALSVTYCLCCRANKVVMVMPWRTGLSGQLQKAFVTGVPSLRRSELESACEDFSNVVGSLSDCYLYKGTLSSGVEIAVTSTMITSAKDWSDQNEAQFRNKISVLSKVNHKNFMNLIGYCEEDEPLTRMMVYEYTPNGTLFEHLHIKEADHLDWATRRRIIMGIAYCLEHMHQLDSPVILKNLSSSSIYLSEDYAAKISDLSFRNDEEKETQLSFETSVVLDPQLSTQEGNVYKFGIILLEIISGRLPFCEDDGLLVLWASSHLNGKRPLMDMVDSTLESFSEEDVTALCGVIKSCIKKDPKKRPTMGEVVAQLRKITTISPDGASPKLSPLWWAELEIISTENNSLQ